MDAGMFYALVALTNAVSQAYSLKQQRQSGTFGDQQQLLQEIRRADADRDLRRALVRGRAQADYESQLRREEAAYALERSMRLATFQSQLQVVSQVELARIRRDVESNPFRDEPAETYRKAKLLIGDVERPLLLIAPFRHEDQGVRTGPDAPGFGVARRHRWLNSPWRDDLALADGLIVRPLAHTDLDVQTIQQTLGDLPVVLLHGDVQARSRVLPELTTWHLPGTQGRPVHLTFPPMALPRPVPADPEGSEERRLALEDQLAGICAWTVAGLSDWFHCLRHGRIPRLHLLLPAEQTALRRLAASNGATLLALAAAEGLRDSTVTALLQAAVLAEGGLVAEAVATLTPALPAVREAVTAADPETGRELSHALARLHEAMVATAPDPALGRQLIDEVGQLRDQALPYRFGLGGSP